MKQIIFYEIIKGLKDKPQLIRKLKIFAVVGIIGFFIVGGFTVWAGISAFNYVASKATQTIQSPVTQQHLESLKAEAKSLPHIQALSCWGKAQSLLAVQPWLERPVVDNLVNLKVACLEQRPSVCEGYECNQMKEFMYTAEGTTI